MLKVDNINFKVDDKYILKDISFDLNSGEVLSIIGSNGAGKSTIIKLIANLIKRKSGDIILFQKDVKEYQRHDLAKVVSYLSQSNQIFLPLTVEDVVMTGRYPYLSSFSSITSEDKNITERMMKLTEVYDMRNRDISSLSGGERQRVFIASSLTQEAKLLLLDEPTVYLDLKSGGEIFSLLKRLNKDEGVSLIVVSHDINNLFQLDSRFLGLRNGELVFDKKSDEIDNSELDNLFDYSFNYIAHPTSSHKQILP